VRGVRCGALPTSGFFFFFFLINKNCDKANLVRSFANCMQQRQGATHKIGGGGKAEAFTSFEPGCHTQTVSISNEIFGSFLQPSIIPVYTERFRRGTYRTATFLRGSHSPFGGSTNADATD